MQTTAYDRAVDKALDFLIYGGLFATLIWSILKSIGVIHTPMFVQQLPFITSTAAILGLAYRAGRFVERIELKFAHLEKDVEHLNRDMDFVKQRV